MKGVRKERGKRKLINKIFQSKFTVIFAILFVLISGLQMQGQAKYQAGTAYQYYLLGQKAESLQEDTEEQKAAMKLGSLGSGGVSGEFSYDEIVNSASGDDQEEAKRFASTMATYSTFNYYSNKVEGFGSILPYVGRFLSLVILLPLAILMDLLHLLIPALVQLIAKFNVIRLLAGALTSLDITADLANMIGVGKETIANFTTAIFSFAIVMILLSLGGMFRTGGRIDQGSYSKLKGRLFSILALPLIVGIGASFLDDLIEITSENDQASGNFSRYLVDDRAWAYNFNFAPNGDNGDDGDINPSSGSSYVDLKYNPYTGDGEDRIKRINSKSSLANNDKGNIFPNTSLVLAFGSSDSFSAVDFINYKGTKASQHYYGRDDGDGEGFGSYYQYAEDNKDEIMDVDKSYHPSGGVRKTDGDKDDTTSQRGGFKEAIKDYKDGDELTVTPQIAWRDRFIYGAKSAGENIDKYYSSAPSIEQMENKVGTHQEEAFSNQSMFLILSTMFNETGGKYYIDAPARGILQAKAAFDSNRSSYYVVSMVGNPIFTMFGLISKPIIQLVIMLAVATAVLSLGIIEMNSKPLMAWLKGMTLGNMEYAQALIVYCMGIGGTVLSLVSLPVLLGKMLEGVAKLIILPAYFMDKDAISPQASVALHGTPLIFSSLLAIIFGYLYIKSPTFRRSLIELFTMAWAWAKSTGERIEFQASGGAGMRMKQESGRMVDRNKLNQAMNQKNEQQQQKPASRFGTVRNWMKDTKDGVKGDLNIPSYDFSQGAGSGEPGSGNDPDQNKVKDAGTIARNGMYERARNNLKENEVDKDLPNNVQIASIDAQEGIMQFHKAPTQENYVEAQNKVDLLDRAMSEGNYGPEKESRVANAKEELYNLSKSHNIADDSPTQISNQSATYDNAVDGLKESELDRDLPNSVQMSSAKAQNAMKEFQGTPTMANYGEAQDKLNVLHSEMEDGNYGQEKEARVLQAKEELFNLSQAHNITDAAPTDARSLDSAKSNETIVNNNTNNVNNQHHENVSNSSNVYEKKEVQQLANSLGGASQNAHIAQALRRLNSSKSSDDVQKGVNSFQQSLAHLKEEERNGINDEELSNSLYRVLDLKNKNEE